MPVFSRCHCHSYVLLLAATGRGFRDEKLCVRTQVSDMQALLGLRPVRFPHQYAGATGSVVIDLVQGSCFSWAFASCAAAWCRSHLC